MARARYVLLLFLVTQISQMTQIFLRGRVWSHRFHRYTQIFYGISGESLCPISGGICNDRTGRFREIPWVIATAGNLRINSVSSDEKNLRHLRNLRDKKNVPRNICVYLWNLWDFLHSQGISFLRGIILVPQISQIYTDFLWNLWWIALSDLRGYLQRPNRSPLRKSVSNRRSRKSPNKFRVIRWWKKSASSAKSAWLKNIPRKICVYLWNLWDKKNNITGPQCSYFVRPSSSNVLS